MALLPSGSDQILEIQTADIDLIIKRRGNSSTGTAQDGTEESTLKITLLDPVRISIPLQGILQEFDAGAGPSIYLLPVSPLFFEQTDYLVTIRSRSRKELAFRSSSRQVEEQIGRVLEDDACLMSGVLNFGNNVGFSDLAVLADGKTVLSLRIEIYPTRLSYKQDYQEMMADINAMVNDLVLDYLKKSWHMFVPAHRRNDVPALFFTILQTVCAGYLQAVNRILAVPHHRLVSEHEVVPQHRAKRTDRRSLNWLQKHPQYVQRDQNTVQAARVLAVRKQITYDTQENQLVRFVLQSTIRQIEDFSRRWQKSPAADGTDILSAAQKMQRELHRLLTTTFLSAVSDYHAAQSMSLVFGMAPGYRELYKYYLMLQNGICAGGDVFHMSEKETAQLYEYWCFLKLYDILRTAGTEDGSGQYRLLTPDIIRVDRTGITVNLKRGKASAVTFVNQRTGERIRLTYNPSERRTQTVSQRPDTVLELEKRGSSTVYRYIFDAKYRIEMQPDGRFYPDSKPGPKVEDINTMHRYRDSIVYENPESRFVFEKTMFGAYILFPYPYDEKEYESHRFYKSIDTVNIGGLPFPPSSTRLVRKLLDELITDSPDSAFERAILPAGIEDRIRTVDWSRRDVLIGLVPDSTHLEIFLQNRLYFTRHFDTARLPIHYVALYEKGSGIRFYGEVTAWKKAERSTLPGAGRHAGEIYHVFEVLQWLELPEKIRMEETGPNPVAYTNFFLLSTSSRYSELRLRSEAEYRLFTEMKRRTDPEIRGEDDGAITFESGTARILVNNENIYVLKNDRIAGACSVADFNRRPNASFRLLLARIQEPAPET